MADVQRCAHLENGLGGLVEHVLVELLVVHGQSGTRKEVENALVLLVVEEATYVGKGRRVGHVDGDGVSVAKRNIWCQLVKRGPSL